MSVRSIESLILRRYVNSFWVREILQVDSKILALKKQKLNKESFNKNCNEIYERAFQYFPHRPMLKGLATVEEPILAAQTPSLVFEINSERKLDFLINIPVAHPPGTNTRELQHRLEFLAQLFKDQSFGKNPQESQGPAQHRLVVVFGVNQIHSIDRHLNRLFVSNIKKLIPHEGINYQVFGFCWRPQWVRENFWQSADQDAVSLLQKYPELDHQVLKAKSAFTLVKALNPELARFFRHKLEGGEGSPLSRAISSQVPYQQLREKIKIVSMPVAEQMAQKPSGAIFYMTMDADMLQLRANGQQGYFSQLTHVVVKTKREKGFIPSVVCLGFQLGTETLPIPRFAVRCCMQVREAMNTVLPGSPYLGEPGVAYYLGTGQHFVENLKKFSFLNSRPTDPRQPRGLESRRALTNGVANHVLIRERVVFLASRALVTSMCMRMKTNVTERYHQLTSEDLKKAEVLTALREVSQTHFHSLEWAHNVYEVLPKDAKNYQGCFREISGFISRLFVVFDPIELIQEYQKSFSVSSEHSFDQILDVYDCYVRTLLEGIADDPIDDEFKKEKVPSNFENFARKQFNYLVTRRVTILFLTDLSLAWVNKIMQAAIASGKALTRELKRGV